MNKEKLAKLAALNNDQANKFLLDFAVAKKVEMDSLKTNEEILDNLEYFDAIFYRVPEVVLEVCKNLLYKRKPLKPTVTTFGYSGRSWEKVQVKALELLKQVRYYEMKEVIKIAFDFAVHKDQEVRSTAIKLVQDISEYNHDALKHVGLYPQLFVYDHLKKNIFKTNFEEDFNPIKVAIEKMLETSSGTSFMSSPDTVTYSHGDLSGGENLAKLRRKVIDFIFSIYTKSVKSTTKNTLAHLLEQSCRLPDNSPRGSDIFNIIEADREYVISELDSILFDKKGSLKAPFSFCMEIERLLYWFFIFHKQQNKIAQPLYDKLTKNPSYQKFSKFVHDDSLKFDKGYEKWEEQNRKSAQEYVKELTVGELKSVQDELNSFAVETDIIGEWKFRTLQLLLEKLGRYKTDIAVEIIKDAVKNKRPLSDPMFLGFLMRGIRLSGNYDLWDKSADLIAKAKNPAILRSIPASLHIYADIQDEITLRNEDLILLAKMVNRADSFSFLAAKKPVLSLNYSIMNTLRSVYALNPKKIETLIVAQINNAPEFIHTYLDTLSMFAGKDGGIDFSTWSQKNKKVIADKIVELPTLDWHTDSLVNNIYSDPVDIIKLFAKRMLRESVTLKAKKDYFDRKERYEAIPYHMNHDLIQYVVSHKDYSKIVPEIIKIADAKKVSHYDLSKLTKHFQISPYLLIDTLSGKKKVTDAMIKKVIELTYDFDGIDVDLAIKLASYTDNEKIHKEIAGMLHSTGVVSGEYGIAMAYKNKADALEKHKDDSNENTRKFIAISVPPLRASEERAKKDADQDKERRRMDFEINNS